MLFGSKLRVGLDIGSHSIKMVAIEKSGQRFKVVGRAMREIWVDQPYELDGPKRSQLVPLVLDLFKELKLTPKKQKNLRTLVGGAQVAAKEIVAIPLEEREMRSAMLMEARKHIPLDGSDTQVDYQILGEDVNEPDKVRALVVATTKKLFGNVIDTLKELEVSPLVVDIEPLSNLNAWLQFNELPDDGVVVMLNIGARRTGVTVIGRKDAFFTREIPVGGHHFTEQIEKEFGVKYHEAEAAKKRDGLKPDLPRQEAEGGGLRFASKTALDRFGDEVNRTLRYYVKETGQSMFQKFVTVGGSAALSEVEEYLTKKFNVTVEQYDPFARMDVSAGNGGGHSAQYVAAVGLAIREA